MIGAMWSLSDSCAGASSDMPWERGSGVHLAHGDSTTGLLFRPAARCSLILAGKHLNQSLTFRLFDAFKELAYEPCGHFDLYAIFS